MKKKVVAAMLAACMAVSLTACGNSDSSQKNTAETKSASDENKTDSEETKEEEIRIVSVKDVSDYVTIGDYKGFTLDRYTQAVTDDDVDAQISYELQDKVQK